MTRRAWWLVAACAMASLGLAFVWELSKQAQRWDAVGVQRAAALRPHRTRQGGLTVQHPQ